MIYTSYFANMKNIRGKTFVSISRITPGWVSNVEEAKELAPSFSLLKKYKNGEVDDVEYEKIYREETLSKLDPAEIYEKYSGKVLLCYESREDFCHRQIVSRWLSEHSFPSIEITPVKLAVIGSRSFNDYELLKFILEKYLEKHPQLEIVSGGASGADSLAERFAEEHGLKITVFEANWDKFGKSAGFVRNKEIWDYADEGIAFWDGESKGTAHSFNLSYKAGKKLFVFNYLKRKFVPRILKGNILESNAEVIAFTANEITMKNGKLVMGAGCAKAFRDHFSGIDALFGGLPENFGWVVKGFNGRKIGAFQTKKDFRDKSSLSIIENSVSELKKDLRNYSSVAICMPGVLNGGLAVEEVLPLFDGLSVDLFML